MGKARFVLVPGAGGSAWYWHRVVERLTAAGQDAVAVELPNHDGATFADHADAIVTAAGDAAAVVLVAQSMGGFAAPMAVSRLPVRRLILVNAMVPLPGETAGEWWEATGQPAAVRANDIAAGRDPDAEFDPFVVFLHDLPPGVVAESEGQDRAPASSLFASPCDIVAWPDVPTTVVVGSDDRLFPPDFQRRVARDRLGADVVVVPGGHLVALGHPDELIAALTSN